MKMHISNINEGAPPTPKNRPSVMDSHSFLGAQYAPLSHFSMQLLLKIGSIGGGNGGIPHHSALAEETLRSP